jgi:hypothetical protein
MRSVGPPAPIAALIVLTLVVVFAAGCGQSQAATATPSPVAVPLVTPDPHLAEPVTADQIYYAIAAGKMNLRPSNATVDQASIVKRIDSDLEGWPLRITAYRSAALLQKAKPWKAGQAPGRGEAPYNLAALNILIEYGPISTGAGPAVPDPAHQSNAETVMQLLDPLLWPIRQHSVMTIPARPAAPAAPKPAASKAP